MKKLFVGIFALLSVSVFASSPYTPFSWNASCTSGAFNNYTHACLDTSGGGSGTVTSVGVTVPPGFSVSGVPITGAGSAAITLSTLQSISASDVSWSAGSMFSKTISSGLTASFSNITATQCIVVYIKSTGSNAVVWPSTVGWSGSTTLGTGQPAPTVSGTDMWSFCAVDSTHQTGQVTPNVPAMF